MGEADGYKLEPARKVRSLDERAKQGDLAGAASDARKTQAAIDAATARVQSIRAAIERTRGELREQLARSTTRATASSIAIGERYLARLRRDLEAALDELDRARASHRGQLEVVDAARTRLARARADKEIVERHFARWRDEKRKLAERRED
ncbi:MAG: hypothetical protein AB7T06_40550 [Kofleriaceae bacterium]